MDKFGRTDWKNYNMACAMLATSRSIDPRTKHGCYIVEKSNKPLTMGYNGPIRGIDDDKFNLEPPFKYFEIVHAEINAICNYNGSLEGATVYLSGWPCSSCLKSLIQKGISKIIYGPIGSVRLGSDENELKACKKMIECSGIEVVEFDGNFWEPFLIMIKYLKTKGLTPSKELMEYFDEQIKNNK